MAGKTQGDLGPDTGKVAGGLEKTPTEDMADAAAYEPASYSSYEGSNGGSSGTPDYGGGGSSSYSADDDTTGDTGSDTEDASAEEDSDGSQEAHSDGADDDGSQGGDEPADDETGDTGEDQPEMWTQPDKHETGNEENNNGHGSGWVGIDIEAMTTLIAAMERARDQLPEYEAEFQRIFSDVNILQAYETLAPTASQLSAVTAWIEEELPGLRRRLALAQELEGGTPYHAQPDSQPRRPVTYDENQIPDHAPHVSAEHGRESALLFATPPDSTMVDKLVTTLRANQHDPYFAHELTVSADPEAVAAALEAARNQPNVDPARVDELQRLLETAVRTAGRGTGELAPAEDFQDQWGRLAGTAQPADA